MTKLEKFTHVFLIIVCCVSLFILVESRFTRSQPPRLVSAAELVGRKVNLESVDWHKTPLTVVLYIATTCHFCNDSMPFYRELMAARLRLGDRATVLVSSREAVEVMRNHLMKMSVPVDKVLQSSLDHLGVNGTPTMLLVDSHGIIRHAFVGKLDTSSEKEVLNIAQKGEL
jgi:hypothetical protein